jgi:hypothetical protein
VTENSMHRVLAASNSRLHRVLDRQATTGNGRQRGMWLPMKIVGPCDPHRRRSRECAAPLSVSTIPFPT